MSEKQFTPKPNSLWLVVVECQYNVVRVSPLGEGFFIPGQEDCWDLSHVAEWVQEIVSPSERSEPSVSPIESLSTSLHSVVPQHPYHESAAKMVWFLKRYPDAALRVEGWGDQPIGATYDVKTNTITFHK